MIPGTQVLVHAKNNIHEAHINEMSLLIVSPAARQNGAVDSTCFVQPCARVNGLTTERYVCTSQLSNWRTFINAFRFFLWKT